MDFLEIMVSHSNIKEIPCQKATLDCGIVVLNYIEKEIGICDRTWSMQQSKYFRIRYLSLILNCNLENFDFPLDIGKSIEKTFPLQPHLDESDIDIDHDD